MSAVEQSVFDSAPPAFSTEQLSETCASLYGVKGTVKPLVSERDQNARLTTADGTSYTVKIANQHEDIALLELQNAAMQHIAMIDPGLGVPAVINSLGGRSIEFHVDQQSGAKHAVRLLSYVAGELLAGTEKTLATMRTLGDFLGRLSCALQGFAHPAAHQSGFIWNLDNALAVESYATAIEDAGDRAMVNAVYAHHKQHTLPKLPSLRMAVIHGDINENNVVAANDKVRGAFDFGDMVCARQINELAIAMAYGLMRMPDIASAAREIIAAYTAHFPLQESELELLFDLIELRLVTSVSISAFRARQFPDNAAYLLIDQVQALELLRVLTSMNKAVKVCIARNAAGFSAVPQAAVIVDWLTANRSQIAPIFAGGVHTRPRMIVSFAEGAPGGELTDNAEQYSAWLRAELEKNRADFAIGLYAEDRTCYKGEQFIVAGSSKARSTHLGIDIFIDAETPIHAPLSGTVYTLRSNNIRYDYGTLLILEHHTDDGTPFYTLYGHLANKTGELFSEGESVAAGDVIGYIGAPHENGQWAPHLHFQIMTTMLGLRENFDGAAEPDRMDIWSQICPDPNAIFQFPPEAFTVDKLDPVELQKRRMERLGPSLSLSYKHKLHIVRGDGCWLYDESGRAYLDCVNNICHVGHCHPHVVDALKTQASTLNTNTRYLHRTILDYAGRIAATFPDPLSVVYFVNSGSEANELALRLARNFTDRRDTLVLDWGYHGNTGGLVDISPYKFARAGGSGAGKYTFVAELPDPYRGRFKGRDNAAAKGYLQSIEACIDDIVKGGGAGPAAFIAESISGCGGQIVFPDAYLKNAFENVRAAGGVCIADEVQTGFGRVGEAMWAFELQNAVPDIVTMGKPMGNGHPLAAVITTKPIANAFANGMEFFNSFGGNPVSCSVGMAVMDVIENEQLQESACAIHAQLVASLHDMQEKYSLIGDIRGHGLFLGIELVRDHQSLAPATEEAGAIINDLRENGVLLSTDGPLDNVLKFKPPMVFRERELEFFVEQLDSAFARLH